MVSDLESARICCFGLTGGSVSKFIDWVRRCFRGDGVTSQGGAAKPPAPSLAMRFPSDFPLHVHQAIADHVTPFLKHDEEMLDNFNGGWMGVAHRFRACADADDAFTASIKAHPSVAGEERFRQEHALFTFIVTGYSAIECFSYGLYWMGASKRPIEFPVNAKDLKGVYPGVVAKQFQASYSSHSLTTCLANLVSHTEFGKWGLARNVLSHRAQPARLHSMVLGGAVTTELKLAGLEINDQTTAAKRLWLARELKVCLDAAHQFAIAEFI